MSAPVQKRREGLRSTTEGKSAKSANLAAGKANAERRPGGRYSGIDESKPRCAKNGGGLRVSQHRNLPTHPRHPDRVSAVKANEEMLGEFLKVWKGLSSDQKVLARAMMQSSVRTRIPSGALDPSNKSHSQTIRERTKALDRVVGGDLPGHIKHMVDKGQISLTDAVDLFNALNESLSKVKVKSLVGVNLVFGKPLTDIEAGHLIFDAGLPEEA